jgi:hypothetical protein
MFAHVLAFVDKVEAHTRHQVAFPISAPGFSNGERAALNLTLYPHVEIFSARDTSNRLVVGANVSATVRKATYAD